MSTATQRRAWNDAMRSAGAVLPPSATTSGGAAASSRRGGVASRAADRRRKRRDKARKSSGPGDGGAGGQSSLEEKEFRVAIHMDMLEGVTGAVDLTGDDDDEYDEFADLEQDDEGGGGVKGKGKANARKRKRKGAAGGAGKKAASSVPKYLKKRSLASILMEEAGRPDSMAKQYVDSSVRKLLGSGNTITQTVNPDNDALTTVQTIPYPSRTFCPVTGLFGEYTEPKTGIPYASLSALEQIRERSPPWMSMGSSAGSASYWEAVKSLQNSG